MASTGGSAHETKMKELDDRMQAINHVLMAAISDKDRVSLNFMLRELKYEKSELQNKQFGDIMAKYGHRSGFPSSVPPSRPQRPDPAAQVITVDSPSPKDKPTDRKGKRTPKRTPGRAVKSSKGLPTPSPPPKSQATKKRKRPTITVSDSDESEELPGGALKTAPSKVYPSGFPKKKKNVSIPSPDRESDKTWSPTPPKKTRVTPKAKKPTQTKAPKNQL